jgi:hypothetical protein
MEHWYRKHITPTATDLIDYLHSSLEDMTFASGVFKGLKVLSVLDLDMAAWREVDNYSAATATATAQRDLFIAKTFPWKHFHTDNLNSMVVKFDDRDSQEAKVKLCTNLLSYIQKEALDYTLAHPTFQSVAIAKALEFRAICEAPANAGKENLAALLVICVDLLAKLGWKPPAPLPTAATVPAVAAVAAPPPAVLSPPPAVAAVATVPAVTAVAPPPPVAVPAVPAAPTPAAVDTEALSPLERLRLLEQKFALLEQKFALLQNLKGFIEANKA